MRSSTARRLIIAFLGFLGFNLLILGFGIQLGAQKPTAGMSTMVMLWGTALLVVFITLARIEWRRHPRPIHRRITREEAALVTELRAAVNSAPVAAWAVVSEAAGVNEFEVTAQMNPRRITAEDASGALNTASDGFLVSEAFK